MADIRREEEEEEEEGAFRVPRRRRRRRLRQLASLERERADIRLDMSEEEEEVFFFRRRLRLRRLSSYITYDEDMMFGRCNLLIVPDDDDLEETIATLQQRVSDDEDMMFEAESEQSQMTVSSPAAAAAANDVVYTVVLNDPQVFDCPICYQHFFTPLFQCANGHIVCSSCRSKLKRERPNSPIGVNRWEYPCPYCRPMCIDSRCRGLEKFLQSINISCNYAHNGCPETMPYSKKIEHEQVCQYGPCFCPYPSCPYADSPWLLYDHFDVQHPLSATHFTYNTTFSVSVEIHQKQIFLQQRRGSVVFILHHEVQQDGGRAFAVDCVGLESTLKRMFAYRLAAKGRDMYTSLTFESVPEVHTQLPQHTLMKNYLTVPSAFAGDNGILSLSVCMIKDDTAALEAQEGERGLHDRDAHKVLKVVLNDPAALNCSICLEPLWTPVFQCKNCHLACSSCCSKLESKCSCCGYSYNRFRGLEKVIESIDKISCKYAKYGCKETMPYNEKTEHEKDCPCASLNTES